MSRPRSTSTSSRSNAVTLVIWEYDTVRDYQTINKLPAKGGYIDGPGPTIANGIVYVNSGYPTAGGTPGNVLLAFSVDGK